MFNLSFTRNLIGTTLILTLLSLGLAEIHDHPETTAKAKRFQPIGDGMKVVAVMKAEQLRYQ